MRALARPSNTNGKGTMRTVLAACAIVATLLGGASGRALAQGPASTGILNVSSDPPAEIFIDDADTKKMTPQPNLVLSAGHHRLKLVTPDAAHERKIGFTIEAGKTTTLTFHLSTP
jgi:hypothetical protein